MDEAGGARPPEFLTTHPSPQTRIEDLRKRLPTAFPLYEKARLAGKKPRCR
jgi:predicted Zn-dependent protease